MLLFLALSLPLCLFRADNIYHIYTWNCYQWLIINSVVCCVCAAVAVGFYFNLCNQGNAMRLCVRYPILTLIYLTTNFVSFFLHFFRHIEVARWRETRLLLLMFFLLSENHLHTSKRAAFAAAAATRCFVFFFFICDMSDFLSCGAWKNSSNNNDDDKIKQNEAIHWLLCCCEFQSMCARVSEWERERVFKWTHTQKSLYINLNVKENQTHKITRLHN